MDATWEVLFTPEFGKQFSRIPENRVRKLEKLFGRLRDDPFDQIPQAKRLKSKSRLFSFRIGDFRLIYRIYKRARQVLLVRVAPRGSVYETLPPGPKEGQPIELLFPPQQEPRSQPGLEKETETPSAPTREGHSRDDAEETTAPLLDEHELFLLGIPPNLWPSILALTDESNLANADLPAPVTERIEDYLTAPGKGQIGKLYRLSPQQGLRDIRKAPLSEFLLELDPDQKKVVERPLDRGPYLIRGAPGTGKTFVALHRLYRVWSERSTEDLFDQGARPWFLFVTYNRSLMNANQRLFERMVEHSDVSRVRFATFDQIVHRMLQRNENLFSAKRKANLRIPESDELETLILDTLSNYKKEIHTDATGRKLIDEHGAGFFHDEFEQVLNGNGVSELEEYLALSRTGCGVRLGKRQRESIWGMFRHWQKRLEDEGLQTWEGKRLHLLRLLESGDIEILKANAIVADEVQDLTPTAIRLMIRIVRDVRFLTLSADSGQSIYHRAPNWRDIPELNFSGKTLSLRRSWRMTREIDQAIAPLRVEDTDDAEMQAAIPVLSGPPPAWKVRPRSQHLELCRVFIEHYTGKHGVNPGQIAIICRYRKQVDDVLAHLNQSNLSAALVDRDTPLDAHSDSVRVMTVNAAKGIEFPFVIVPFVADGVYPSRRAKQQSRTEDELQEALQREQKILYVALSRASRFLYVLSDPEYPSPFLDFFDERYWDKS